MVTLVASCQILFITPAAATGCAFPLGVTRRRQLWKPPGGHQVARACWFPASLSAPGVFDANAIAVKGQQIDVGRQAEPSTGTRTWAQAHQECNRRIRVSSILIRKRENSRANQICPIPGLCPSPFSTTLDQRQQQQDQRPNFFVREPRPPCAGHGMLDARLVAQVARQHGELGG